MRPSLIETLRKLIEHEKSAYAIGNIAEAEAFAEKFQQLMEVHELTMADLGWQSLDAEDEFDREVAARLKKEQEPADSRPSWQEVLGSTMGIRNLTSSR
jgi:hypothetical protein